MKQNLRQLCCSLLLLLAAVYSYGQAGAPKPDAKFIPSVAGQNSSIGNSYSPNLYDGSINVTIPIYDFSNDHGSYGVSFGYNTKGVRVDEISGLAGLHWTINAGGSISRVLKDLPDELNEGHSRAPAPGQPVMNARGRWTIYTQGVTPYTQADGENDEFVVSVGNLNFTFSIGAGDAVFTHPNRRVRIEKQLSGSNILNFTITDESGNRYYFKPGAYAQGRVNNHDTINDNQLLEYGYTSRWEISRIVFAEGSEILYDYADPNEKDFNLYANFQYTEDVVGGTWRGINNNSFNWVPNADMGSNYLRLLRIRYPNGTRATFSYDTLGTNPAALPCLGALKEVSIEATAADNCIRYVLDRGWQPSGFGPGSITAYQLPNCEYNTVSSGRLMLQGINMKSCDGSITEAYYRFAYSPYLLPRHTSGQLDRFGYNNAAAAGSAIGDNVPLHTIGTTTLGSNRSSTTDINVMSAGNLVQMTNAFGGSVSFTYEQHSGLQNVIPNLPTDSWFMGQNDNDGLRVKTITETDKHYAGNARVTTFTYSGGQRFLTGGYFHYLSQVTGTADNWTRRGYIVGPYRISPLQLINGSNHGYSQVTAERRDQSGSLLGRTEYVFSNLVTGTDTALLNVGSSQYYQEPYTDRQYIKDWKLGLPLVTSEYDQNNQILSRVTNTYSEVLDLDASLPLGNNFKIMRAQLNGNINPFTGAVIATDTYRPYTGKALLASTSSEKFVNGGSVSDQVQYGYDSRNNTKWIKTRNSRGIYTLTENVYNYDAVDATSTGALASLRDAGLEKLVGMERWSLGTSGANTPANKKLLDASITRYEHSNGRLRSQGLYTLQTGSPMLYGDYTVAAASPQVARYYRLRLAYDGQPSPPFLKASEVKLFDAKGNPLETQLLAQDVYKAMLWDTITGDKLAEASNAHYNDIAYTSFDAGITDAAYTGNEIITSGRFSYRYGGLSTGNGAISGSRSYRLTLTGFGTPVTTEGLTIGKTYILSLWSNGPAPVCNGTGVTVTFEALYSTNGWTYYQAEFTPTKSTPISIEAPGVSVNIDELRLFPIDAQMQSWIYKPLCGAISATDAAGRITYYEYDGLGRPTLVRNQEGHILSRTQYVTY